MRAAAALLVPILLGACSALPKVVRMQDVAPRVESHRVYVVSHGWHTGVIVDAAGLNAKLPALVQRFPGETWYEIGWGDAGFYRAKKITVRLAVKAVFWLNPTVVHVVAFRDEPVRYFSNSKVVPVTINDAGYRSLLAYLDSSFARTADGAAEKLGAGLYGDSEFYAGTGKYFLFNTCNTWTTKALASSGFFGKSAYRLTSSGVMREIAKADRRRGTR